MKLGCFFQAPEAPGHSHADRYAEMIELIGLADRLGFDVAWLAELHFGGAFSLLSNPLMLVPVIAERVPRIRIGTAVTLLPLHHPLACAEQAATADVLSGGRLEFGVGRGSIPSQFHGFRVPLSENRSRFVEALGAAHGLSGSTARNGPTRRTIARLCQFRILSEVSDTEFLVRMTAPRLSRRMLERLPEFVGELQDQAFEIPREDAG